jgi:endonuclease G
MSFAQERPEIHCKHFFAGYPYGSPASNDLIIRDIYALSNNDATKFADWVAYRLDKQLISGTTRSRNWAIDPWLDASETLEPGDYDDANAVLASDRGHQAPLASFDGSPSWRETNYLSNITPQKSDLNEGPWGQLEAKVRKLVNRFGEIHVMTGPLYERTMPRLPNADEEHSVPSGYWKIIIFEDGSHAIHAAAFIFNQETQKNAKVIDHLVTIDEIESRSHLDFLWELSDAQEDMIEADKNIVWATTNFS